MISTFISQACRGADALIIVPPFGGVDRPSLGAHILQACARQTGLAVDVLYCNLLLAKAIGLTEYEKICYAPSTGLVGERFFSDAAYGIDAVALYPNKSSTAHIRTSRDTSLEGRLDFYRSSSAVANAWTRDVAAAVARVHYPIVGCSTTFEQTSASIAILTELKRIASDTITIMGGANCEDQMARGILSITDAVDYVFSGECEQAFPSFLHSACSKAPLPTQPVISGEPCSDLSSVPIVDFEDYYHQLDLLEIGVSDLSEVWLPYESSRGCWWGQKHHCLFCGINGQGLRYREKSATQVEDELRTLMDRHPTDRICMVDNIMPHSYFRTLLPSLASKRTKYHFFYEQKANLRLNHVELLKNAGVNVIQPGIEALSTPLLKLMGKGVTAPQNFALLRFARMTDLFVNWNILHSFPNDKRQWFVDTLSSIRKMNHLNPPTGSFGLSIDRFSPYFSEPEKHGIEKIRPIHSYSEVFPPDGDLHSIAYHFEADYRSESREDITLLRDIEHEIAVWRSKWEEDDQTPTLNICQLDDDIFLLLDTRIYTKPENRFAFLTWRQAMVCLFGKTKLATEEEIAWAVTHSYCLRQRNEIIPLAIASVSTYQSLERTNIEPAPHTLEDISIAIGT